MRWLILVVGLTSACTSPTAPSYTCTTQFRTYTNPVTGASWQERDTYVQSSPCPGTPIR